MTTFDSNAAARRLAEAWRTQAWFDALPEGERPATREQAYEIQDRLAEALGEPLRGWKVAGGSVHAIRASLWGRALFGFVPASCLHASGVALPLPPGEVTLEVEVALRFARDISPADEAFEPSMVESACVAIEVVRSRFHDRVAVGVPSFVADDAGLHALVLGERLADGLPSTALETTVALLHETVPIAGPLTGQAGNEVAASLRHFWGHAIERGLRVPAGAVLTTGTQTRPVDFARTGALEGRFGDASVRLSFV